MSALQGMDMNQFIIIAPSFLIAVYVFITLQKKLCNGKNPKHGLILPVICFIAATILAFRPLFIVESARGDGMIFAALTVWMTFNIPTLALLFPYLMAKKKRKQAELLAEAMAAAEKNNEAEDAEKPLSDTEAADDEKDSGIQSV